MLLTFYSDTTLEIQPYISMWGPVHMLFYPFALIVNVAKKKSTVRAMSKLHNIYIFKNISPNDRKIQIPCLLIVLTVSFFVTQPTMVVEKGRGVLKIV